MSHLNISFAAFRRVSDPKTRQTGPVLTDSERNSRKQDMTRGRGYHKGDAEYSHLVELGHWHHLRQRRRNRYH